ncbi:MAG TPA: response regulator [Candidatus Angelobacter sp.]|nr:response regulator [Candidatus Angelobacter sp.]
MRSFQQHPPSSDPSAAHIKRNSIRNADRESTIALTRSHVGTILFVDDDTAIVDAHRLFFEELGYTVHTANSGEEALQFLETHAVDAVVVDYLMPGMDGEETARRTRSSLGYGIPIILFSGSLCLPKCVLEAFDACVEKGLGTGALAEALEFLLH